MHEALNIGMPAYRSIWRLKSWQGAEASWPAGQSLPSPVGAVRAGPARCLCIGPGDWLLSAAEPLPAPDLPTGLEAVDMSHGLAVIRLTGATLRERLSAGCSLDLHPSRFAAGECARTRLAQIAVVFDCLETSCMELYVARSHAHYLHQWLQEEDSKWTDTF